MRNPGQRFFLWLALLALGIVLVTIAIGAEGWRDENWLIIAIGLVGVTLIPFGLVYSLWALVLWRGRQKLLAGHRRLARWHVSADEWRRFLRFEPLRVGSAPGLHNDTKPEAQDASRGLEVIVSEVGVAFGDYYQVLRRGGLPALRAIYWLPAPADPQCLEFHVMYPRKHGGGVPVCVRFPIGRDAHAEARRVYDHFEPLLRPRQAIALRNPRLTIVVALSVAALSGAAALWGLRANHGDPHLEARLVALVVGAVLGPAALIMALATALLARRRSG